jgi:hypothetical protein
MYLRCRSEEMFVPEDLQLHCSNARCQVDCPDAAP